MKKITMFILIPVVLCGCLYTAAAKAKAASEASLSTPYLEKPEEPSKTDSVIALLLYPHINAAIRDYFGEPTQSALYDAKVTNITQIGSDFNYQVTIAVPTFHGAHNPPYGLETLTFSVSPYGVKLDCYEHKDVTANICDI